MINSITARDGKEDSLEECPAISTSSDSDGQTRPVSYLAIGSPLLAISATGSLLFAILTPNWLRTEETLKNLPTRATLPMTDVVEVGNPSGYLSLAGLGPGTSNKYIAVLNTVSGLWTLCQSKHEGGNMSCSSMDFCSSPSIQRNQDADTLCAITSAVMPSCPMFLLSLTLMLIAQTFSTLGQFKSLTCAVRKRRIFTFISGIIFILGGLVMLFGMVVYISIFKTEVGKKLHSRSSLVPPDLTYSYGYSFLLVILSFLLSETAGTCAIFLYLYHHQLRWKQIEMSIAQSNVSNGSQSLKSEYYLHHRQNSRPSSSSFSLEPPARGLCSNAESSEAQVAAVISHKDTLEQPDLVIEQERSSHSQMEKNDLETEGHIRKKHKDNEGRDLHSKEKMMASKVDEDEDERKEREAAEDMALRQSTRVELPFRPLGREEMTYSGKEPPKSGGFSRSRPLSGSTQALIDSKQVGGACYWLGEPLTALETRCRYGVMDYPLSTTQGTMNFFPDIGSPHVHPMTSLGHPQPPLTSGGVFWSSPVAQHRLLVSESGHQHLARWSNSSSDLVSDGAGYYSVRDFPYPRPPIEAYDPKSTAMRPGLFPPSLGGDPAVVGGYPCLSERTSFTLPSKATLQSYYRNCDGLVASGAGSAPWDAVGTLERIPRPRRLSNSYLMGGPGRSGRPMEEGILRKASSQEDVLRGSMGRQANWILNRGGHRYFDRQAMGLGLVQPGGGGNQFERHSGGHIGGADSGHTTHDQSDESPHYQNLDLSRVVDRHESGGQQQAQFQRRDDDYARVGQHRIGARSDQEALRASADSLPTLKQPLASRPLIEITQHPQKPSINKNNRQVSIDSNILTYTYSDRSDSEQEDENGEEERLIVVTSEVIDTPSDDKSEAEEANEVAELDKKVVVPCLPYLRSQGTEDNNSTSDHSHNSSSSLPSPPYTSAAASRLLRSRLHQGGAPGLGAMGNKHPNLGSPSFESSPPLQKLVKIRRETMLEHLK